MIALARPRSSLPAAHPSPNRRAMCARRFLIAIFILTLLAVAGAVAVFQFGQSVLIRQAVPRGHFEAPPAGSGPD